MKSSLLRALWMRVFVFVGLLSLGAYASAQIQRVGLGLGSLHRKGELHIRRR